MTEMEKVMAEMREVDADKYRLFAKELLSEIEKRDFSELNVSSLNLRERNAYWESPLSVSRKYSAPVREFLDVNYDGRVLTMDLQYAYGDYLTGVQIEEIVNKFSNGLEIAVKGDIANLEYARSCKEEELER